MLNITYICEPFKKFSLEMCFIGQIVKTNLQNIFIYVSFIVYAIQKIGKWRYLAISLSDYLHQDTLWSEVGSW